MKVESLLLSTVNGRCRSTSEDERSFGTSSG